MSYYQDWNRLAKINKEKYPQGTRIKLLHMNDPFSPVEDGMRGTVVCVDDAGQLHMKWDNGRTLALNTEEDSFRVLTEAELAEERGVSEGTEEAPVLGM